MLGELRIRRVSGIACVAHLIARPEFANQPSALEAALGRQISPYLRTGEWPHPGKRSRNFRERRAASCYCARDAWRLAGSRRRTPHEAAKGARRGHNVKRGLAATLLAWAVIAASWGTAFAEFDDGPGATGAAVFSGSSVYVSGAQHYPLTVVAEFSSNPGVPVLASCLQDDLLASPLAPGLNSTNVKCDASGTSGAYDYVPCPPGITGCGMYAPLTLLTLVPVGGQSIDGIIDVLLHADDEIGAGRFGAACGAVSKASGLARALLTENGTKLANALKNEVLPKIGPAGTCH